MTTTERERIQDEIDALTQIEVHVRTNQGTYGAVDACRLCGTGDPRFANREEYETVGGLKRTTGPDEQHAPGRMRDIGSATLAHYRHRVAALREKLRTMK